MMSVRKNHLKVLSPSISDARVGQLLNILRSIDGSFEYYSFEMTRLLELFCVLLGGPTHSITFVSRHDKTDRAYISEFFCDTLEPTNDQMYFEVKFRFNHLKRGSYITDFSEPVLFFTVHEDPQFYWRVKLNEEAITSFKKAYTRELV